ncbi:MAG TPA: SDR family NAD(P)-dependent oxidoreductase [Candidatus Dormibacteraeota bacterium]|nr:SDR family NAD(P)-dependent oxidoreductase [Candidatus Dormibacteraeota bacterium]
MTGGGRGLGRVLATFLSGQGYDIVITSRTEEELHDAAASLRAMGAKVSAITGDINDPNHRTRLLQETNLMGGVFLLVNNASDLGETPRPELARASLDRFRQTLETNLVSPLALIQQALPQLQQSHGLVINITSDAGEAGYERWGIYGSSKAGLDLVSKTLAAELKPLGISVVAVDPGDMRTQMHQEAFPDEDISDRPLPEVTLPFWAWLIHQDPRTVSGMRYEAQGALWEIPA